ncbi:MAG: sn-glycerol-3-phosphate ABC transporter ATP-binding protein UgpC [Propionivibrio sp.]|jgi:multiple sugar transport system ATP-binding protein|uniref:ABC transporter ATP-binding protein n=1 Tax=Propionivibrio sp. TaxID=2212460 RepID=UPI001B46212C|nr:sn-glycerol-3-phosphate ABC transporter ATP-binding protein UgpC [Propionivibrio sp.]MBP7203488.1 sn-glycerol-3-phosphate ABC transporter ATP-binding protein UgpC [Propionivibrio sp.]
MADLELKAIRKSFGQHEIIKGVDISIEHGEFVVFVGPSGCGKSTLLRLIAGLEEITSGTLDIGGRCVNDLPPKERSIAMVFQSYALFPHMTVFENMAFGLSLAGEKKDVIDSKVRNAAAILKMEALLDRKPSQLSGGQRQRVAIGRAIVRNPQVFLFDEPLSNLDAALRVNTRAEISRLHCELGATMIYVTHDQVEAMTLADKIVVLEAGHVRQIGSPLELYHRPQNQFVAGFIGSPRMNFLTVEAVAAGDAGITVRSPDFGEALIPVAGERIPPGASLTLGIRPESVKVGDGFGVALRGQVELVERLGHETFIEVLSAGDHAVTALVDGKTLVEMCDSVTIGFDPVECHLFDASGDAFRRLQVPEIANYKRAAE